MGGCTSGATCACTPALPDDAAADACSGGESFALMVLGDSMAPEFNHGEIIIVEPDGALRDGSFVLALVGADWVFRCLRNGTEGWWLEALAPGVARTPLPDLAAVRGVVIQKALPGRRRASKRYV